MYKRGDKITYELIKPFKDPIIIKSKIIHIFKVSIGIYCAILKNNEVIRIYEGEKIIKLGGLL